ncbi:hypothetical protein [Novosphingobium sp.]|uniref:hypothetical protein n=1 Tax=Novosphingobium sp. TaxID=1874826 RepID=UPI0035AF3310
MYKSVFVGLAACISVAAIGQSTNEASPDQPVAALESGTAYLRTGTEVPLKLAEALSTKHKALKVGQRFRMETSEAVLVQGVVVIPAGSPAVGEITEVRNKGMWGKSGHFTAQVRYVTVNGRQIRLSGTFDEKGTAGGVGATAVSAIVFLPAGFFMTGTSAQLPIGAPVKGFVDEDVPLTIMAAPPAPLVIGAPQPSQVSPNPAPAKEETAH